MFAVEGFTVYAVLLKQWFLKQIVDKGDVFESITFNLIFPDFNYLWDCSICSIK